CRSNGQPPASPRSDAAAVAGRRRWARRDLPALELRNPAAAPLVLSFRHRQPLGAVLRRHTLGGVRQPVRRIARRLSTGGNAGSDGNLLLAARTGALNRVAESTPDL